MYPVRGLGETRQFRCVFGHNVSNKIKHILIVMSGDDQTYRRIESIWTKHGKRTKKELKMSYSEQMLARAEHDRMVKSLPSVSEYPYISRMQPDSLSRIRAIFLTLLHLIVR